MMTFATTVKITCVRNLFEIFRAKDLGEKNKNPLCLRMGSIFHFQLVMKTVLVFYSVCV